MIELYESQRAMRNMRRAAMQRGVIAILDVGSSKIACLVLRFDGSEVLGDTVASMAGQAGFRVIGAATTRSRGVRFGEIDTMAETERAIRTAVQAAQKMANIRVDHVVACFSGGDPRSYGLVGDVDLDGHVVSDEDVSNAAKALKDKPIDLLILNAGIMGDGSKFEVAQGVQCVQCECVQCECVQCECCGPMVRKCSHDVKGFR